MCHDYELSWAEIANLGEREIYKNDTTHPCMLGYIVVYN